MIDQEQLDRLETVKLLIACNKHTKKCQHQLSAMQSGTISEAQALREVLQNIVADSMAKKAHANAWRGGRRAA